LALTSSTNSGNTAKIAHWLAVEFGFALIGAANPFLEYAGVAHSAVSDFLK
jgi:hypothetical protein